MARKPAKAAASLPDLGHARDSKEIRTVGVREFRANFRDICDFGAPVIVKRGRYVAGVFFPGNLNVWNRRESRTAMVQEIVEEFPNVKRKLEKE